MIGILCADLRYRAVKFRSTVHSGNLFKKCVSSLYTVRQTPACGRAVLVLWVYRIQPYHCNDMCRQGACSIKSSSKVEVSTKEHLELRQCKMSKLYSESLDSNLTGTNRSKE